MILAPNFACLSLRLDLVLKILVKIYLNKKIFCNWLYLALKIESVLRDVMVSIVWNATSK